MDAKSGSGSFGTFIWGIIAGLIAVIAAGGLYLSGIFSGGDDGAEPPTAEVAPVEPETQATETTEVTEPEPQDDTPISEETAVADTPDVPEAADPNAADGPEEQADVVKVAPVLDQIFVEPDGNALLSGTANPGAEIDVVLDGEIVHSFTVDDTGQFAEFLSIPFADSARGLVLQAHDGQQSVRSDDYLIAALPAPEPEEAPSVVAEAPVAEETQPPVSETEPAAEEPSSETERGTDLAQAETQPEPVAEPVEPQVEPEVEAEPATEPEQQVAILRSGEEGVELVQPPAAQSTPPEQVALDTIGYSDAGDVELTGRAQQGSAIRLYLNNRLVADLPPSEDGKWRSDLNDIDPGVYTLRVDEVTTDGTVVSRLETPFKREPVELLQEAGATNDGNAEAATETPSIRSVTVQKGDTLWAISRERFGDGILYVKLFDANRDSIRDPDLIYPGQIFTIPE